MCIAHNNCMSCPSIWASYLHCSLIYFWVPSSCFCIVTGPLSGGWRILFSGVCQSGGGCIIHAGGGGGFTHWLTDWPMCNRRRPAATSSRRASFSALASATFCVFCIERSNITLTHLHVSNCRVRQFEVLWHFCRAGLCRYRRYQW